MSNQKWAALVYGRSFHVDFRYITVPVDFTEQEQNWASQHILGTMHQARNLMKHPRWSLFKNQHYAVVGVTCMVRDLLGYLGQDHTEIMTKDDQNRPLYVFVGYVTRLFSSQILQDFPSFLENHLDDFKPLYREIEKVWLVKNYEADSRKIAASKYRSIKFLGNGPPQIASHLLPEINSQIKHPQKLYLWPSISEQNHRLWSTSAQCPQETSICLNIQGKALVNSPFLNQTIIQLDKFKVRDFSGSPDLSPQHKMEVAPAEQDNFTQKISTRARQDLDLTIQQASKVANASQELLSNFSDWSGIPDSETANSVPSDVEEPEFGFKTKKISSPSPSSNSSPDWF